VIESRFPAERWNVPLRSSMEGMVTEERLQKLIARSGLCSRREADQMIRDGRVTVNGRVAEPGAKADPDRDHVKVDGKRLKPAETPCTLLLYKPRGVMTTCSDPEERPTVLDIVRPVIKERVYPVGRLDFHSEGLLLLTNDGDLAARITHPKYGVVREYTVKIRGDLSDDELARLRAGTVIEGRRVVPLAAERVRRSKGGTSTWWKVEVAEGRTHEVRQLFFRAGHLVQRLKRTAIGPLRDASLRAGEFRTVTASEIEALRRATGEKPRGAATRRAPGPKSAKRSASARSSRKPPGRN